MKFPYRYIARITVEAETPLMIGGDSLVYDQDNPVDKDFNNLPYIPGTAIAGFLRSSFKGNNLFGDEKSMNSDKPLGSNIIVSDGYLLNSKKEVFQIPTPISEIKKDDLLKHYINLPLRQHTKINHLGAADEGSKFDQEFAYKGSRFKFEISLETENDQKDFFNKILNFLKENSFYIGSGMYNNFGELKVEEIQTKSFNLKNDLNYLETSVDLNCNYGLDEFPLQASDKETTNEEIKIELDGSKSFFHFGSGLGDEDVDDANYIEQVIEGWKTNEPEMVDKFVIPGTSIKGALAHRVAYHYNKKNEKNIESIIGEIQKDNLEEISNVIQQEIPNDLEALESQLKKAEAYLVLLDKKKVTADELINECYVPYLGENNNEVKELFGTAKNSKENKEGQKGNLIVKDIYFDKDPPQAIFIHNKIDRFTQGTIEGALFSEKALAIDETELIIKGEKDYLENKYLQLALTDLRNGLLPLGGKTNKGHGVFVEKK